MQRIATIGGLKKIMQVHRHLCDSLACEREAERLQPAHPTRSCAANLSRNLFRDLKECVGVGASKRDVPRRHQRARPNSGCACGRVRLAWAEVWFTALGCLVRRELLKPTAPQCWEGASLFIARCCTIEMHREAQRCGERSGRDAGDLRSLLERCCWRDGHYRHHIERADAWVHTATFA